MTKKNKFSIPFERLKRSVLGKDFELSLVFADDKLSRRLNRIYRGKNKPANVLSFPLSKKSGEIFIDLITAEKEAPRYGLSYRDFVKLLFVHGLLHLKGMRHGRKMERTEKKLLYGTSSLNGHRHRNLRN
ncbi:MAG: rRNA maturation RNase YbeY [Minisyncoccia bacterium]